jgi:hypothetical protein
MLCSLEHECLLPFKTNRGSGAMSAGVDLAVKAAHKGLSVVRPNVKSLDVAGKVVALAWLANSCEVFAFLDLEFDQFDALGRAVRCTSIQHVIVVNGDCIGYSEANGDDGENGSEAHCV